MTDPTQFMVDQSYVHKLLQHQGVLGSGRDFLTQKPCSLHLYNDSNKQTYVMQHYQSVTQQFVSTKMTNLTKTSYSNFVCNITRVCFVCTRKMSKDKFDLSIFYDATSVYGYSLEYIIKMKAKNEEKFEDDEIYGFFWQIADFLQITGKNTGEFLEITPVNIFCKPDQLYGFNFFPNNFGLSFDQTKWQRKYYNKKDSFWQGDQSIQAAVRTTMFALGMILLQLCSLEPTNSLYDSSGVIDEKLLQKRLEGIKITRPQLLCSLIKSLLNLKESDRLTLDEIYIHKKEYLKNRRVDYYENIATFYPQKFKTFEGIIEDSHADKTMINNKLAIGEALDMQLCINRGRFIGGKLQGLCMKEQNVQLAVKNKEGNLVAIEKNIINIGKFEKDLFMQGIQIHKNEAIYIGKTNPNNHLVSKGIMIALNISMLNISNSHNNVIAFDGEFDDNGRPKKGTMFYQDGKKQIL